MRFFIALEIPQNNKTQLKAVQDKLKDSLPSLRLTDPEKLHLTIAFIGEKNASLKDSLIKILQQSSQDLPSFEVTPAYIDGFPNLHHPQTLWCGVKGDIDKLMVLRERVKDQLANLQLETDPRRFVPHITLAKGIVKITPEIESQLQHLMLEINFSPIKITSVKLFESVPSGDFHHHNTLCEVRLI